MDGGPVTTMAGWSMMHHALLHSRAPAPPKGIHIRIDATSLASAATPFAARHARNASELGEA
jgi:hypothetical protein